MVAGPGVHNNTAPHGEAFRLDASASGESNGSQYKVSMKTITKTKDEGSTLKKNTKIKMTGR